MFKKILREPLVHFIVIGVVFFIGYQWLNPEEQQGESILVTEPRVNQLIKHFQRTWKREPSKSELETIVNNHVLDEIYYREAKALGIDKNDEVIRRRLRQKMEFMVADVTALADPEEEELVDFYQANSDKYRKDPQYSFSQVLIKTDRSAEQLKTIMAQQQARIEQQLAPNGDNTLLPQRLDNAPGFDIDRRFGQGFAQQLDQVHTGTWQGPIRSGLGLHFVNVDKKTKGSLPPLNVVRDKVLGEWRYQQNKLNKTKHQQSLLSSYQVAIEWPDRIKKGPEEGLTVDVGAGKDASTPDSSKGGKG